ncbi:O-acetyl-ADP-ribose deacetylase [Balamuthia mandrillaris]
MFDWFYWAPKRPEDYPERKETVFAGKWQNEHGQTIELRHGDITMEDTVAIVNAANSRLAHGSGVAGAIRHKGGPVIMKESEKIIKRKKEVPTGEAVLTHSGWLYCKYVIHAVGPIWSGGKKGEPEELVASVKNSLLLAHKRKMESIAMPAIGSGIFGFPKPLCAELMFQTTIDFFNEFPKSKLRLVRFTNFDKPTVIIFQQEFEKRFGELDSALKIVDDSPKTRKKGGGKGGPSSATQKKNKNTKEDEENESSSSSSGDEGEEPEVKDTKKNKDKQKDKEGESEEKESDEEKKDTKKDEKDEEDDKEDAKGDSSAEGESSSSESEEEGKDE